MAKWVLGNRITPQRVTGDFDLVIGETPSLKEGPPPHFHNVFHEVFLVVEGEMEFIINGETQILKQGESVNLPPQTIHTFSNNSNELCKWINIHSPKGFLKFFEELGVNEKEDNAEVESLSPEIIQKVIETASNYDMILSK